MYIGRIMLPALLLLAFLAAPAPAAAGPVTVQVAAAADATGARVSLTFSRHVEYRLEESRSRLRMVMAEPVAESSMVDSDLDSDVVRRIRFDQTSHGTDLVFHLGRAFATFSSVESSGEPFRVTLQFQREGAAASGAGREGDAPGGGEADADPSRIIVIDPGHGGSEQGAVSHSGLKEKDLVLDIARRLKTRLEGSGYRALLTHDDDASLGLTERTAFANHAKAALFLSIHANSSSRPAVRGAETYFLSYGATSDEQAAALARHENDGGPPGSADDGSRPEISAVLWEMAQAGYLNASSRLAGMIQTEMNALGDTRDRGVKQAPFRVLVGAAMPAVLIEVGFLTNDDEEKKLASQEYRDQIAQALAGAVQRFTQQSERAEGPAGSDGAGHP